MKVYEPLDRINYTKERMLREGHEIIKVIREGKEVRFCTCLPKAYEFKH